jgi:hypothetical protein
MIYSVKEQDQFRHRNRANLTGKEAEICKDWPEKSDVLSDFPLSEEQLALVGTALTALNQFSTAQKELLKGLPENAYIQIFGDWNLLKIGYWIKNEEEDNE